MDESVKRPAWSVGRRMLNGPSPVSNASPVTAAPTSGSMVALIGPSLIRIVPMPGSYRGAHVVARLAWYSWAEGGLMTRREFMTSAAGTTATLLLASQVGAAQRSEDMFFEWKPVCEGARAAFGNGGNALVVTGKQGALLVDCKNSPFGQELRREADTPTKLTHVVNTHHHGDHTGGNHAFTPDLPVIAQTNATPRILGQLNRYVSQIKEGLGAAAEKQGQSAKQVLADH